MLMSYYKTALYEVKYENMTILEKVSHINKKKKWFIINTLSGYNCTWKIYLTIL